VRDPASPRAPHRRDAPPPGGTYRLVSLDDGVVTCLRTGINAIGRFQDNDIVLEPNHVSRRHCVILVHATGSCEVYDTASRNGTWVNHRRVGRVYLLPGDSLMLSGERFVIDWIGPNGESLPAIEESGSSEWGGSATCVSL
jgi:pSer/pThr/pTyr-binding forkhead associated (FHA) protein